MKKLFTLTILIIFLTSCNHPGPATVIPSSIRTVNPANSPSRTHSATTTLPSTPPLPKGTSVPPYNEPNIIFILTDDLDASAMQYMPKMKALIADQGETFPNYFVSESLCCPSRATTLRGQYSHNTQILSNKGGFLKFYQLGEENSTISVWLQQAGYQTMLAGKYLNGYPPMDNPLYIPPGWNEWYSPIKGNPYTEYNYALNENGTQVEYAHKVEDYGTDVYFGKTVDFIQRQARLTKPFFVYLAPYAPHHPYRPAPRHANLFTDLKAPRPLNYNEADVSDKPAYIRDRTLLTVKQQNVIDEDYRKRIQSLQAVDEGIENIVNTLSATGQLDNTFIFFSSDNGYHLGNHRQYVGKISPYEEEMRVTMVVRGPGVPSGVTLEHITGNIDLAPTWAELAGTKPADFCDGRSLVPLLNSNPPPLSQWRQAFLYEYGQVQSIQTGLSETPTPEAETGIEEPPDQEEKDISALPIEKQKTLVVPTYRGFRTQTFSYVEYKTGEIELYNIRTDPFQLQNLASTADPELLKQFSERLKELMVCTGATCREAEGAPFVLPASFTQSPAFGVNRLCVTSPDYKRFLVVGTNVTLTISILDPSNIILKYNPLEDLLNAGFPFRYKEIYQRKLSCCFSWNVLCQIDS